MRTTRLILQLVCSLSLVSCVSKGPYFNLNELEELVKERIPKNEVLDEYGPPTMFNDRVFAEKKHAPKDRLLIQEVDGLVFSDVDKEQESDYNDMEFADWEKKQEKKNRVEGKKESLKEADFVNHNSDTTEINDCASRSRNVRYIANRSDPNGYTERQFTVIYFDKNQQVCGFRVRSWFLAN